MLEAFRYKPHYVIWIHIFNGLHRKSWKAIREIWATAPGGATWFQLYPDVCVNFRPQVSEMSDMILLKMGVNCATSLNMGGRLPQNCIS